MGATAAAGKKKRSMMDVLRALRQPKMAVMLALGFSSGLPFMLFGNTLGFWLAEGNVKLATIGFVSWAGMMFLIKFVWGALVDRFPLPVLGRLGRRRGWMVLTQAMVGVGLVGIAATGPQHIPGLAVFAVLTALGSAMQDTVIDAWRIEIADDPDELGLLTACYTFGYRIALFAAEALILVIATAIGWPATYVIYAGMMGVGLVAALLAREPARTIEAPNHGRRGPAAVALAAVDAVVQPFIVFFREHGPATAALMLLGITLYHLCDYMRGPMSGPYYLALGIDKPTIAAVRGALGIPLTLAGVTLGGVCATRFGVAATLLIGAVLQPIGVAAFAILGMHGSDFAVLDFGAAQVTAFQAIMAFDALAIGFSGLALTAYMSTLTSVGYTATQYALLTSAMAWSGKFLKGFSGEIVQAIEAAGHDRLDAYALFYLGCGAIGAPAVLVCMALVAQNRRLLHKARAAPA